MNKELTKSVNAYIANIGVGYIKLHNLHWNTNTSSRSTIRSQTSSTRPPRS